MAHLVPTHSPELENMEAGLEHDLTFGVRWRLLETISHVYLSSTSLNGRQNSIVMHGVNGAKGQTVPIHTSRSRIKTIICILRSMS